MKTETHNVMAERREETLKCYSDLVHEDGDEHDVRFQRLLNNEDNKTLKLPFVGCLVNYNGNTKQKLTHLRFKKHTKTRLKKFTTRG